MTRLGYDRAYVDEARNAVGELGPADAVRTIVLLGHIDTVPGNIPVRIEQTAGGELLHGRGSVDAKGPLATFVATGARAGSAWAHNIGVRVVVVGAVEEEATTSKGARFVASRFNGSLDPIPTACVVGEPSQWHRLTLGCKGRLRSTSPPATDGTHRRTERERRCGRRGSVELGDGPRRED